MLLRDVMTKEIEGIPPHTTLTEAAKKMKSLDVGILPVREKENVVGMITDRDIAVRAVAAGRDPKNTPVRDAMTPEAVFCYDDQDVTEAAKVMEEKEVRRVLVFDRQDRLVGIVSLGDLATRMRDDELCAEVLGCVSKRA
jgi:CBS domain-containing protein